jgi:hypothetical protein
VALHIASGVTRNYRQRLPKQAFLLRVIRHSSRACTLQVTSAKNLPESEQSEALAIQDKRKTPTRKPNNE